MTSDPLMSILGDSLARIFPRVKRDSGGGGPGDSLQIGSLQAGKAAGQCRTKDPARLLSQKLPTLSKTPDAPSVQAGLALFQRIGVALVRLVGSSEGLRIWMNAPNPQLEGRTPLSIVLEGQGEGVAEMLEDMLVGQPA